MNPVDVVQSQVDAYNARDLQRFIATFSDAVQVFRPPSTQPSITGKAQLSDFYATQRFNLPGLHADIVNRMVMGNKVIDHERISGVHPLPFEAVAVYEVSDGLIKTVWFFQGA